MGRIDKIKTRLYIACKILFDQNNTPLKIMDCQRCGGIFFDTIDITTDTEKVFQAIYKCKKCGSIIKEEQKITRI